MTQHLPSSFFRAEQVRELDRIAIEEIGIPGITLMQRAGLAAYELARRRWPKYRKFTVFTGIGNNAGDGFVLATLARADGLQVEVVQLGDGARIKGDALSARNEYLDRGGAITAWQDFDRSTHDYELAIDGLFGTGLQREVTGPWREAIEYIDRGAAPVLALDIPSGLSADTGAVLGVAVRAQCTITFIGLKQGMFTAEGRDYCGEIVFDGLQVPDEVYLHVKPAATAISPRMLRSLLPRRRRSSHKADHGHLLIVGGGPGMLGATRLAGEAALRTGAGLVTVASHPQHSTSLALTRPELMCRPVEGVEQLQPLVERATVIVIGPGLGLSAWAQQLFSYVFGVRKPLLVDADGLNLLARSPQQREEWILTPHPGEAGRLLGCPAEQIQQDRFASLVNIVKQYNATVVLKGAGSLVRSVKGSVSLCTAGNPGMATAGMGDVLSGVIGALIAQRIPLDEAARLGTLVHAQAADFAAGDQERGLLASDLMPHLRQLVNPEITSG